MNLQNFTEKISYIIGRDIAQNLQSQGFEIEPAVLFKGFEDAFKGHESLLSNQETQSAMRELQDMMEEKQSKGMNESAGKNKAEGEAFLAENKNKEGVVTLPSGLQYQVIKEGEGESPKRTDMVTTHYHGTLINGKVFDSSYERGNPATFPVNGVIAGWTEALLKMKKGSKWKLFIPSELAYGKQGAGSDIGPNTTLIFDVELLDIK